MLGAITSLAGDVFSAAGGISSAVGGLGGWFETPYQAHFQRKATDHANFLNQQNQYLNLVHGPSLQMEGLRRAGINPLLPFAHGSQTLPSISGASALSLAKPNLNFNGADRYQAFSARKLALESAKEDIKGKRLENKGKRIANKIANTESTILDYEKNVSSYKSVLDSIESYGRLQALADGGVIDDNDMTAFLEDKPTFQKYIQSIRSRIDRDDYQSSRGHAIFEDVLKTLDSLLKIKINAGSDDSNDSNKSSKRNSKGKRGRR